MSSVKFRCSCGYERKVSSKKYAGKKVSCPECSAVVRLPRSAAWKTEPTKDVVPPPVPTAVVFEDEPDGAGGMPALALPPLNEEEVWDLSEIEEEVSPEWRGYAPRSKERSTVHWLATIFFLLALFGMGPALLRLINWSHYWFNDLEDPPGIYCWTCLLLIAGIVQLAYAIYLYQLPDWSTVWVIALVSLFVTTAYTVMLVIELQADLMNPVLVLLELHQEKVSMGKQAAWCFCVLLVNGTFTYFAGRYGIRWKQEYKQMFASETPSS
ncbi:MAG: hypothetical protein VB857_12845 [Pirellulaceae bacterium]